MCADETMQLRQQVTDLRALLAEALAQRDEERRKLRKAEIECSMLRVECGVIAAIRDDALRERDSIRRTFCFIIASGNLNARDGNTAFRIGAEHVAELNHWKCFKEESK
ncbi:MAG: hypothetical protein EBR07_09970 [Planctomycetes bacterium]|nr:hypothetical protein [Planctomycetota bacterium]